MYISLFVLDFVFFVCFELLQLVVIHSIQHCIFSTSLVSPFMFPVVIASVCCIYFIESTAYVAVSYILMKCSLQPTTQSLGMPESEWLQNCIQWMLFCDMLCTSVSILLSNWVTNRCSIDFWFCNIFSYFLLLWHSVLCMHLTEVSTWLFHMPRCEMLFW